MSGIAGICRFDGAPVDAAVLRRMTDALRHRGPDGVGHWIDGGVGLGHRMLHTTPESLAETQPLGDDDGGICLVMDGRIDNRTDLRRALEAAGVRLRADTDAELLLAAYRCWGDGCPARILGDFAFAVWDRPRRRLLCARDPATAKPFYYHVGGGVVRFASEIGALLADAAVPREPNEGMIAEYLADDVTDAEETLYRGILRLPGATLLVADPSGVRTLRYWDIDPRNEIRYRTDDEYAEHLLGLLNEAVRCRLRSHGSVGVELSGGLDSSSITGVAQTLYREGRAVDAGFEAFSVVPPRGDESAYARDVADMWNLKCNFMTTPDPPASHVRMFLDPDASGFPGDTLRAAARARGFRVLLNGRGGDEMFTGSFYHYADLLRSLRIATIIRQARVQVGFDPFADQVQFPPLWVFRLAIVPLLPRGLRQALRRMVRPELIPDWIDRGFGRRIGLTARLRKEQGAPAFRSHAQAHIYGVLRHGHSSLVHEIEERVNAWSSIEQRHPLMDRRIVEFALALPEEQRWRGGETRFILRHAMRGRIPESVRRRFNKVDGTPTIVGVLEALGGERAFRSLSLARMGWVDEARVRRMYDEMIALYRQGATDYERFLAPLWMILAVEVWFNATFADTR